MRIIIVGLGIILLFAGTALAQLPAPRDLSIGLSCNSTALRWNPADSAQYHPVGYVVFRKIGEQGTWQELYRGPMPDSAFYDSDLVYGDTIYYGIRGDYGEFDGAWLLSGPIFFPNPANFDYFLVGNTESNELNLWYKSILDSLGLNGTIVSDVLPYCGEMLAGLRLLWIVTLGDNDGNYYESTPKDLALVDYLNHDGRLFVDNYGETHCDTLCGHYLFYQLTTCVGELYISIQGNPGTFAEGLSYQFPDSQWSTNLRAIGNYEHSREVLIENVIPCGCADVLAERDGYKAIVNSVPLHLLLDNDQTGTRLEYFRRMLQYFDIITSISDETTPQPTTISLTAYPNPFNAQVRLSIANLSQDGLIGIYDIAGRLIRKMPVSTTNSDIIWDGRNEAGVDVSTGIYFAKIMNGRSAQSVKLTMLK